MQENSYIQVLIQSLHQKVEALDSIIEKNQEQYEILSAEEADMDAFEKNIDEKSQYIDKIVFFACLCIYYTHGWVFISSKH